ncbi:MAG: LysM peptidoglycan-binding domain-containing protein [Bacillota bacterium]
MNEEIHQNDASSADETDACAESGEDRHRLTDDHNGLNAPQFAGPTDDDPEKADAYPAEELSEACAPGPDCPPNTEPYTIAPGDTCSRLARRFNTTVAAMVSANPFVDLDDLDEGQIICIPRQPFYSACPEGNYYTIQSGDNFSDVAQKFNVSLDDMLEANPLADPEDLRPGQVICVPVAIPPAICPEGSREYTIRRGDTFFVLARRFNTTVEAIRRANPDVDPESLLIGMTICIPEPPAPPPSECPEGTRQYTIEAGDTLFRLADHHNTTVDAIIDANPGIDPDRLRIGQRICLPEASSEAVDVECAPGTTRYRVRERETLFQIANRNRLHLRNVLGANPHVTRPDHLERGQLICLPRREATAE